jgi:hypothetical protein
MSTRVVSLGLTDRMRSLAESQLQMQTARSAALDGGALGVMAVDAAIATFVVDTGGAHHFWIGALVLLGLSLGLVVQVLRSSGARATLPWRPCAGLARPKTTMSWANGSSTISRKTSRSTTGH